LYTRAETLKSRQIAAHDRKLVSDIFASNRPSIGGETIIRVTRAGSGCRVSRENNEPRPPAAAHFARAAIPPLLPARTNAVPLGSFLCATSAATSSYSRCRIGVPVRHPCPASTSPWSAPPLGRARGMRLPTLSLPLTPPTLATAAALRPLGFILTRGEFVVQPCHFPSAPPPLAWSAASRPPRARVRGYVKLATSEGVIWLLKRPGFKGRWTRTGDEQYPHGPATRHLLVAAAGSRRCLPPRASRSPSFAWRTGNEGAQVECAANGGGVGSRRGGRRAAHAAASSSGIGGTATSIYTRIRYSRRRSVEWASHSSFAR
jgi:hypothetical protein